MASFTCYDAVCACLPCLRLHSKPRAPPSGLNGHDELEGLLDDAETLSLHSNTAGHFRLDQGRSDPKRIHLFGFDLFGRPPIQLPPERGRGIGAHALDSDAAPLDSSVIESLAPPAQAPAHSRVQQKRMQREHTLAAAFSLHGEGEGFEGFQGSGAGPVRRPQPSPFSTRAVEDAEDADLDGELYTRAATLSESGSRSSSSRSHSNTTASSVPRRYTDASSAPKDVPPRRNMSSKKSGATSESSSSQLRSEPPATPTGEETRRVVFDGYPLEDGLVSEELFWNRGEGKDVLASLGA